MRRQRLAIVVAAALALLAATVPAAAQQNAWEALGVGGGSVERDVLERLTPAQAEAWLAGADPSTIVLADGTTLDEHLIEGLIDTASNSVYHPLNQCVVVKTTVAGGKFAANDVRNYLVRGPSTDLSAQGGSASGCGVATDATAVVLNVKPYQSPGNGQVFVYPTGHTAIPSVLNVTVAGTFNNMVTAALGSTGDFTVKSSQPVHLVIHTVGYFSPLDVVLTSQFPTMTADYTHPGGDENMPPWLGINCVISLDGTFPPRSRPGGNALGDTPDLEGLSTQPYIGGIGWFAGNFNPRGWAFCDGQLLPISSHTALFSILGTTYGGDGRTTFALPDMRGRVPLHPGSGSGLRPRRLGEKGGIEDDPETHKHNLSLVP